MTRDIQLPIKRLPHGDGLPLPAYQTAGSVGMDICAAIPEGEVLTLTTDGQAVEIPTGFAIAVPEGYEAQIRSRSGLAFKNGISIIHGLGTIDPDYTGELMIKLCKVQLGADPITIRRGDRVAQMMICPVMRAVLQEVEELPETERGEGGLGSTGVR